MTSDYVDVSIKLFSEVGNDEYIVLCNFGGLSISGLISYQSQQLGTEPYIKTVTEYNIQHLIYSTVPKLPYISCGFNVIENQNNPGVSTFKNLLEEICHLNIQRYKNLFSQVKSSCFYIWVTVLSGWLEIANLYYKKCN